MNTNTDYTIDWQHMTITNGDSHGAKAIIGTYADTIEGGLLYHLVYVNDDGHLWAQLITEREAVDIEQKFDEMTPLTYEDVF